LSDLDELVLLCRNEKARSYIAEAVACYRSGAFRSAIVATWVAACFDVIAKLRELALAGDKAAEQQVRSLDNLRSSKNLPGILAFERGLLALARDKFDLFGPSEAVDLERLQEDRNRCAHPSLTGDDQEYSPPGELARLHIHSAVQHLLQHPPAQGKYALQRLTEEVESDYFPRDKANAIAFLSSGPLRRPRESLVRNLIIILLKPLLRDRPDWKRSARLTAALQAVADLHHEVFHKTLRANLSDLMRGTGDQGLARCTGFLQTFGEAWQFIDADLRQRLQNYVEVLPRGELSGQMGFLLQFEPLREQAVRRATRMTAEDIGEYFIFELPPFVAGVLAEKYVASVNFDSANSWGNLVVEHVRDFSPEQVRRIVAEGAANRQVRESFGWKSVLGALRAGKKIGEEEFDALVSSSVS